MILLISLLAAFLIFVVLYYVMKTKVVPDNQVHQRLRDLQGAEGRVITSHADELNRVPIFGALPHTMFLTSLSPPSLR